MNVIIISIFILSIVCVAFLILFNILGKLIKEIISHYFISKFEYHLNLIRLSEQKKVIQQLIENETTELFESKINDIVVDKKDEKPEN